MDNLHFQLPTFLLQKWFQLEIDNDAYPGELTKVDFSGKFEYERRHRNTLKESMI